MTWQMLTVVVLDSGGHGLKKRETSTLLLLRLREDILPNNTVALFFLALFDL